MMFGSNSCLTHTFWIGVLIAILLCFGFKGCHSADLLPCVIQAKPDRNVAVRVGPGNDRAIRFYLPDDENFIVIGHATAADDTHWWKIESNDIAQAWVAQTDVTSIGNCEAVGNAAAPPIIENNSPDAPIPPPAASPTASPTLREGESPPPTDPNDTPAPPPTQGQITNTPPNPTDPPTATPLPSSTGTAG